MKSTFLSLSSFQTRMVLSGLVEAKNLPSGLKEREVTLLLCPLLKATRLPSVVASHHLMLPFSLPEARCSPSGLNARQVISSSCNLPAFLGSAPLAPFRILAAPHNLFVPPRPAPPSPVRSGR